MYRYHLDNITESHKILESLDTGGIATCSKSIRIAALVGPYKLLIHERMNPSDHLENMENLKEETVTRNKRCRIAWHGLLCPGECKTYECNGCGSQTTNPYGITWCYNCINK